MNLAMTGAADLELGCFAKVPGKKLKEMATMVQKFHVTILMRQNVSVGAK